jgi:hypothetical protein
LATEDSRGQLALWLTTWDEISKDSVVGFQLRRIVPSERLDKRCVRLPRGAKILAEPKALYLGMSRKNALAILGPPSASQGAFLEWRHQHEERVANVPDPYTWENNVELHFNDGVVDAFYVGRDVQ